MISLVGGLATLPYLVEWASTQALVNSPSLLPGLTFFLCLALPICVPNQTVFGIGSALPKAALMWLILHSHENTDLGVFATNNLTGTQPALAGMAVFSLIAALMFVPFRIRLSPWLMFGLGVLLPLPCMIKIEVPLVVFHIL